MKTPNTLLPGRSDRYFWSRRYSAMARFVPSAKGFPAKITNRLACGETYRVGTRVVAELTGTLCSTPKTCFHP